MTSDVPARRLADRAVVPLARAHGLVFVELERDGAPLLALVDTGANASAVDPRRADGLALLETVEVVGTTGTLEAELVALEGLRLGERALPALRATRRDLSGLLSPDGRPVEMILGSDAFAGAALTLDFDLGRLELADGAATNEEGVAMRLDQGIPVVEAALGGVATWLRIDTGASLFATSDVYVNVPPRLWEEIAALDASLVPTSALRGTGASGGPVDLPVVPVPGAHIGPQVLERAMLVVQPAAGYFAAPDAKGFVSCNWLEKLGRVTLDYAAGRLRAEPAAERHGRFTGAVKPVLYVRDVERSAALYRDALGFELLSFAGDPADPYYADLAAADLKFGLHEPTSSNDERKVGRQRLYFRVEDVAAHRARVVAHGVEAGELRETAWMTMVVVVDPDGNEVVFAETDPARHTIDPW